MALRSIAGRLPIDSIVGGFSLGPLGRAGDVPFNVRTLAEAGVIRPMRPDKLARVALAVHHWGTSPAAGIAAGMITRPDAVAIQEESGEFSFRELTSARTRSPAACATPVSRRVTASRSWRATTTASSRPRWRARSLAPTRST